MPRRPRLLLPGVPLHITQRGVNRAAVFHESADRRRYLDLLAEAAPRHDLSVHAWVLMDNHVHLLVTPARTDSLAPAMRLLNQRYVTGFNRRHARTGTLWESRFHSCLVDSHRYALAVQRYIELNPVRAGMVERAEHHPWSSASANLGLAEAGVLTAHPAFLALGEDATARARAWREWLDGGTSDHDLAVIRAHIQQQRALGAADFCAKVERALGRPVAIRRRGRPVASAREPSAAWLGADSNG